jgi:hypothetical protein
MASQHVAENPFHAECLKLVRKLRECNVHGTDRRTTPRCCVRSGNDGRRKG